MDKYIIDTKENREFLAQNALDLLNFGRRFPSPGGGSYYLGDDGTPWIDRPRETWITSRMAHVYSIGAMMGVDGCKELAAEAIKGLNGELRDDTNGGWFAGRGPDGTALPTKQCYAHAFVILAGTSAKLAGVEGADALLTRALKTYDEKFWDDEEGLSCDTWNTEFTVLDDYRGINANMHTVEAFLAAADMFEIEGNMEESRKYRTRAGRIIKRVLGWASSNDYRIPEHFTKDWQPDLQKNKEKPDDPFKPYGATPGHGIEWARLISQWAVSAGEADRFVPEAEKLYNRAIEDAWNRDGAPGIVYTTDWEGRPVVRDRMHWTLAEAINTSAVLYRLSSNVKYKEDFSKFMDYLDSVVIDHSCGSWYHQLDENNHLKGTVWPGKSDVYHAFQAMLIPYRRVDKSIATAVKTGE